MCITRAKKLVQSEIMRFLFLRILTAIVYEIAKDLARLNHIIIFI